MEVEYTSLPNPFLEERRVALRAAVTFMLLANPVGWALMTLCDLLAHTPACADLPGLLAVLSFFVIPLLTVVVYTLVSRHSGFYLSRWKPKLLTKLLWIAEVALTGVFVMAAVGAGLWVIRLGDFLDGIQYLIFTVSFSVLPPVGFAVTDRIGCRKAEMNREI